MTRIRGAMPPKIECPFGPNMFQSPKDAYVFSEYRPALEEVIAAWSGHLNEHGNPWTPEKIRKRCKEERWEEIRALFERSVSQAKARALAEKIGEQEVANLEEATKRHRAAINLLAAYFQGKVVRKNRPDGQAEICFEEQGQPIQPKAGDVIRAVKEYVQLDRQVLGLADQVNRFYIFVEMSEVFVATARKYITDPATLRAIFQDVEEHRRKFERDLDLAKGLK